LPRQAVVQDLRAVVLPRPSRLRNTDHDFVRIAVGLDDTPLQAEGAECFKDCAQVAG
jgi:hypothetical protein